MRFWARRCVPRDAEVFVKMIGVMTAIALQIGVARSIPVDARNRWNASGVNVRRGEVYAIEVAPNQFWRDASHRCGPAGYEDPKLDSWKRLRRRRDQPWFALIGAVGKDEATGFP